ncbi:MAG: hypothetical protein H6707_05750 [Deltaproteobacteria bacterium]|nr:hypothetical protein [Deltaproteobacteria bacterium]
MRFALAGLMIGALIVAAGCGVQGDTNSDTFYVLGECPQTMPNGAACVAELPPPEAEPQNGGCWVTGIGHIGEDTDGDGVSDQPGAGRAEQDSFGGNAMGMKDGRIRGQWQNTTHLLDGKHKFHGQATFLHCFNDGGPGPDVPKAIPNRAIWGGPGQWDHQPGYLFIVSAADYKEGKDGLDRERRDAYAITIYRDVDGDGHASSADQIVYEESDCIFGNFQIHPPNQGHPYTAEPVSAEMDRISSTQTLCPALSDTLFGQQAPAGNAPAKGHAPKAP